MYILGISAYYHDSAAAIIKNGVIVAAVEEERFSRKKHDSNFPIDSIKYCLSAAGVTVEDLEYIVFYEKPFLRFERILETFIAHAPYGIKSFLKAMPSWLKYKINMKKVIFEELEEAFKVSKKKLPPILYTEHHLSHAASAFFPSPFEKAAVLCLDGVGEWTTTSAWLGEKNTLKPLWELHFPHSLGLLYSAFTYYVGFKVNSGEYKLMGLAPYGEPKYKNIILENLISLKEDGTFKLNMKYFAYTTHLKMINNKFCDFFGAPARLAEGEITQHYMDIASSIQAVCEEIVIRLAKTLYKEMKISNLCLAGGVALNCVANGKILKEAPFKNLWIQPAAGDSGGALGAALSAWYLHLNNPRVLNNKPTDSMKGSYLGPSYSDESIKSILTHYKAPFEVLSGLALARHIAHKINKGEVVGWVQGRMEFGPRSLGNRSILGDPRKEDMQYKMNIKIKYRESFRPFAPIVKEDKANLYFDLQHKSPYMLLVAPVKYEHRIIKEQEDVTGLDKLKIKRSTLPAITHVDYSARIQTVNSKSNPLLYSLLDEFEKISGVPILINTSFNIRGEPIVCSPQDAYRCFMRTDMDCLVLGNFVLNKHTQPVWHEGEEWKKDMDLD